MPQFTKQTKEAIRHLLNLSTFTNDNTIVQFNRLKSVLRNCSTLPTLNFPRDRITTSITLLDKAKHHAEQTTNCLDALKNEVNNMKPSKPPKLDKPTPQP